MRFGRSRGNGNVPVQRVKLQNRDALTLRLKRGF
jgi:hypothetical protein